MNPEAAARRIVADASAARRAAVDPRSALNPVQRDVWECTARIIKLLCGRQSGKTYFACIWLLAGAMAAPGSLSVYLALTQKSARNIAWDDLVRVGVEVFGLPAGCFREHTLTARLPNGARILVAGADDVRTIETWRGTKLLRAVIDEMGSQRPDLIAYFVREIIWPALVKNNGRLALLGTPGLVCDGYWWDLTKPDVARDDLSVFRWDIYSNPAIPHAESFIEETLHEFGWTRETPQFRREWLGEWVQDRGALVYPFDPERNSIAALPTISETGQPIPPRSWRHVIGHDVGVVDPCAWVIWAWNPAWPGSIATHAEQGQYDPDPAFEHTRQLLEITREISAGVELVVDTGGMGKAHERIYRSKGGLSIVPAEKLGKASAIAELRGDLLSGAAKVLEGAQCDELRAEWCVLGWDKKKLVHNPDQPDHVSDGGLYSYRRIRHYHHQPNQWRPAPVDPAGKFLHDQDREMREAAERHRRQRALRARVGTVGRLDR